ncbi:MAG: ABC transporter substrate-binding protein [Syntrophobacteraceae bacterium]
MKKAIAMVVMIFLVQMTLPAFVQAQGTVKIGALWPLSGPIAEDGQESIRGAKIAAEMQNDRGGLWGNKIELVTGDASDAKAAMSEAERLITVEKTNIIMGTWVSGFAFTASQVAEKYKKVYWETAALANNIMERRFNYLFHASGLSSNFGEMSADFVADEVAKKLGKDPKDLKVAVVYEDSLHGTSISEAFIKKAKVYGFKLPVVESYNVKAVDLSSLVMKLKEANPDVLFGIHYFNDLVLFWRQAKEVNFNVEAFISCGSAGSPKLIPQLGEDVNYLFNTFRLLGEFYDGNYSVNLQSFKPETVADLKEFFKRYSEKYNVTQAQVPNTATLGFSGAWMLLHEVLPKCKSDDPEEVRKAALAIDLDYGSTAHGVGMKFAQPGTPNQGLNEKFVAGVFQWQDGKFYCVWPDKYAVKAPVIPMPKWDERKKK